MMGRGKNKQRTKDLDQEDTLLKLRSAFSATKTIRDFQHLFSTFVTTQFLYKHTCAVNRWLYIASDNYEQLTDF